MLTSRMTREERIWIKLSLIGTRSFKIVEPWTSLWFSLKLPAVVDLHVVLHNFLPSANRCHQWAVVVVRRAVVVRPWVFYCVGVLNTAPVLFRHKEDVRPVLAAVYRKFCFCKHAFHSVFNIFPAATSVQRYVCMLELLSQSRFKGSLTHSSDDNFLLVC